MEKELLQLLNTYHHYKFMTRPKGVWNSIGYDANMNLFDFFQWLESRDKSI